MTKKPFTLLLHISLALIVAGGLLTALLRENGYVEILPGESAAAFESEDGTRFELPFSLRLDRFRILYYPGTRTHKDYVSRVTVLDGGVETPSQISMNHILKHKGYRFCQAGYDLDTGSTVLQVSHDPWGIAVAYTGFALLVLSMLGFFFQRGTGFRAALSRMAKASTASCVLLFCAVGAIMLMAWIFAPSPDRPMTMPVLRSPLLTVHVFFMMSSYTLFAIVALNGIAGLCVKGSSRELVRDASLLLLYPAEFLIITGTIVGAVWANISWGAYWSWDPKETWALVTILVYCLPLHGRILPIGKNTVVFHWFCIIAILSVLTTYFGVNLLFGGMHSYA